MHDTIHCSQHSNHKHAMSSAHRRITGHPLASTNSPLRRQPCEQPVNLMKDRRPLSTYLVSHV
ncbi:hypothetical protein BDR07DRAFT_1428255 [Suillus spraguei]|nr:hypothetical protein BDR07DRAFT_1436702 [Suillus spraguei]KAG2353325.1 hypothetical protein BDR07DRAFT_1433674 [Suillus spraguei]KAG2354844.1 hypothetical protein BDR07DRAFT_1428255 [Suillus spraguei]